MKESEKWLALCDPNCPLKRHFPNCVCCDIALEYRRCKSEEQADKERVMDRVSKAERELVRKMQRKTHADEIRAMSDEELAVWLAKFTDCGECPVWDEFPHCTTSEESCACRWHEWLKKEVSE